MYICMYVCIVAYFSFRDGGFIVAILRLRDMIQPNDIVCVGGGG